MALESDATPEPSGGEVPEHIIDHTPEYEEFIEKLKAYHEKRGTPFEPEPKVGSTHLDLLKVFKKVVDAGGYDKVSDEKLAWRTQAAELGLHSHNTAAIAFALKSAFYKYLAAYEITTIHKKEPPPPSILEHLTAKGGKLLSRTIENYSPRRDVGSLGGANASGGSDNDGTPSRERRPDDTTVTPGSGRASRGLREAPPQRVIFQPDTGSSRQSRQTSAQHAPSHLSTTTTPSTTQQQSSSSHTQSSALHSHAQSSVSHSQAVSTPQHGQPHRGPSVAWNPSNPETVSKLVQNFEPRGPVPLQMRGVETPANAPAEFERRHRLERIQAAGLVTGQQQVRAPPGTSVFEGPNIYIRCLCALRSGVPSEQAYALHHFTKISFERWDKFKLEGFPGLPEGLVEKGLEVGGLFFDVNWTVDYSGEPDDSNIGELDGLNGTPDILERISKLRPKIVQDAIQPTEFADHLSQITEAALTIRNCVVSLPENALHMADFPPAKDLLCVILHLPNGNETVVELKHLALDIAEQLTPFLVLASDDALYRTLLAQLNSTDRGTILTSLRAIARISMNLEETNRLGNVPASALQNILDWLLLNDDELMDACLDFLYQYTAVVANVETLLKSVSANHLVSHLVRLLSHGAKRTQRELALEPERKLPSNEQVLPLPEDLKTRLLTLEEPDRCYAWLRCLFEEDSDSAITQIAIWHAYQASFAATLQKTGRPMIGAAEFIRNVSHVFTSAGAQIVREGERGEVQRFIIKGVRPRLLPVGPDGRDYLRCLWKTVPPSMMQQQQPSAAAAAAASRASDAADCGRFFPSHEHLFNHIMADHLRERRDESNRFPAGERDHACFWGGCTRFRPGRPVPLHTFTNHLKTHALVAQQKANFSSAANSVVGVGVNGIGGENAIVAGGGSGGNGNNSKRATKKTFIQPPMVLILPGEETLMMRDERTGQVQAAGIPLSAVLVLRNLARNVVKTEAHEDMVKRERVLSAASSSASPIFSSPSSSSSSDLGKSNVGNGNGRHYNYSVSARPEPGGWLEVLFRPVQARLFDVMVENRVLSGYVASLLNMIRDSRDG